RRVWQRPVGRSGQQATRLQGRGVGDGAAALAALRSSLFAFVGAQLLRTLFVWVASGLAAACRPQRAASYPPTGAGAVSWMGSPWPVAVQAIFLPRLARPRMRQPGQRCTSVSKPP